MIDMHYDLLSVIYQCYLKDDYTYIEKWAHYYQQKNVIGLIANLYFMNEEEMEKEIGTEAFSIDVVEMFRISTELFRKYFPQVKVVFSIEGCDYIKDTKELEELYQLGLRNILLVWNNKNKYGSGNRSRSGLTKLGEEFLIKAIDLGISIDLSHMNVQTFYDTVALLKKQKSLGKEVKVIVSHSNCYELCPHPRNLTKEQLLMLREFHPIIGLVSYEAFVSNEKVSLEKQRKKYLEHIQYISRLLGVECVGISTDNMDFGPYFYDDSLSENLFDYSKIKRDLTELLKDAYNKEEIEKILYKNIEEKLF